ncbi:hypothetical protein GGX14DRAFT_661801 [Mycena pura]|uniref:Cysteine protease n=1 Tax=Mycena pura TaxID=153505 RepID=A0AAD6V7J8_9AGAR|nr:hypothetical protein GGX14DRAFT_661801 [Mycena pura]
MEPDDSGDKPFVPQGSEDEDESDKVTEAEDSENERKKKKKQAIRQDDAAGTNTHKRKASDAGIRGRSDKGKGRHKRYKLRKLAGLAAIQPEPARGRRRRRQAALIISTRSFLIAAQRQDRLQAPQLEGPTRKCQQVGPHAPPSGHQRSLHSVAMRLSLCCACGGVLIVSVCRSLVNEFSACGLGVCVATDSTLFQSEVFAASHSLDALLRTRLVAPSRGHGASTSELSHRQAHDGKADGQAKPETRAWGDRPVLLLLCIRLGLAGVNPVYHETKKMLYTFSQSVGIAGGRPSSSYYFVSAQGDGLFYLGSHHSRPAVPPRPFLDDEGQFPELQTHDILLRGGSMSPEFERGGSMSPELVYARGSSLSPDDTHGHGYGQGWGHTPMTEDELVVVPRSRGYLTPAEEVHYSRAYSVADLRTYHCERVRKMPLTGLDPSMLIGFLVRDEAEWRDCAGGMSRRYVCPPLGVIPDQCERSGARPYGAFLHAIQAVEHTLMLWTNRQHKEQRTTADQYSADNWGMSSSDVGELGWAELHDAAAEWKEKKWWSAVAASSSCATSEADEVSDGEGGIVLSD